MEYLRVLAQEFLVGIGMGFLLTVIIASLGRRGALPRSW